MEQIDLFRPRLSQALRERPRRAREAALYRRAALVAAEHFAADPRDVLSARRRKGAIAEARALAAYLTVVVFDLSRRSVGRLTGRSGVLIARCCTEIETARENPATDAALGALEARLRG